MRIIKLESKKIVTILAACLCYMILSVTVIQAETWENVTDSNYIAENAGSLQDDSKQENVEEKEFLSSFTAPELRWDTSGWELTLEWDSEKNAVNGYEIQIIKDGEIFYTDIISYTGYSLGRYFESVGEGNYKIKVRICATDTNSASEWSEIEYSYRKPDKQLDAPINVRWSDTDYGTILWDTVENASGYSVMLYYINDSGNMAGGRGSVGRLNGTYDFSGRMEAGKRYVVKIQAISCDINEISSSEYVISAEFVTPSEKINCPTNLHWEDKTLVWDAVDGAEKYYYELYLDGKFKSSTNVGGTAVNFTKQITQYGNGIYTVKLQAISSDPAVKANSDTITSPELVFLTPEQQVKLFTKRLYQLVLNRETDDTGIESWANALLNGESSGVDIGYGFVFSPECIERKLSDSDFVEMLYNTFMNRPSDEGGKSAWVSQLETGVEREKVLEGFIMSQEFAGICEEYGIAVGKVSSVDAFAEALAHYCNQNPDVTAFVARCYTQALGRAYDPVGLEDWCRVILTQEDTPTAVAKSFIFSDEFVGKGLSDEEYVKVLYRTFMGREADEGGLTAWVGVLQSGEEDREKVLEGFANSQEFAEILESFGLN